MRDLTYKNENEDVEHQYNNSAVGRAEILWIDKGKDAFGRDLPPEQSPSLHRPTEHAPGTHVEGVQHSFYNSMNSSEVAAIEKNECVSRTKKRKSRFDVVPISSTSTHPYPAVDDDVRISKIHAPEDDGNPLNGVVNVSILKTRAGGWRSKK